MRIEELSVGDWVMARQVKWDYADPDTTEPMQIVAIDGSDPKRQYVDLSFGDNTVVHSAFVEDLQPIPITPDILEKNGFVRNGKYKEWNNTKNWDETPFIGISLDRQSLRVKNFGRDIFIEDKVICVHELQRSLRLAWADKKIEL